MSTLADHPKTCEVWSGGACTCPQRPAATVVSNPPSDGGRKLRLRSLDDVKIVPTRYLWTDYLPVAELAMLVGKPGVGKSTVAADVAAKLTTGHLTGSYLGRPQNVLYSLTEDSEGTFKARFIAADGDAQRLHIIDVVHGQSDGSPLLVNADLDQLRAAILEVRPALVVLDALNSSLDGQQNDNSNIRPQLEKLKALGHQTNTAILGIGHFRKSTAGVEPLDAIGGAGAYGQIIRQAVACARDEDDGTCTLSVIKTNGQSLDVASLAYRIEEAEVPADDGGKASVGHVSWLGESATSVRDLLQRTPQGETDRSDREEVTDWLIGYLAAQGGTATSKDVFKAGGVEGYSKDQLKRAKGKRIRSAKVADRWLWEIVTETTSPSPAREQQGSKNAGNESAAPLLPSLLPCPNPTPEPVRQLHLAPVPSDSCDGKPGHKRAPNGKCVGCIVEKHNRLARGEDGVA